MRRPVLIGRESERTALARLLQAARAGRGGAGVLAGDVGIGKTRMVGELQQMATRAGMVTPAGRADPASTTPLAAIAETLLAGTRAVPVPDDEGLGPYVPLLATFLPHWRAPGWHAPSEMDVVLAEGILRLRCSPPLPANRREGQPRRWPPRSPPR
jgi:AAA ATPase domain